MTTLETIQTLNENLDIDPATVAADSTFEFSVSIRSTWLSSCARSKTASTSSSAAEGLDTVGKLVDYIDGLKLAHIPSELSAEVLS